MDDYGNNNNTNNSSILTEWEHVCITTSGIYIYTLSTIYITGCLYTGLTR